MLKIFFRFLISRYVQTFVLFLSVFLCVKRFESLPRRSISCPHQVAAVSPDGSLFAAYGEEHGINVFERIEVYETQTMKLIRRLDHNRVPGFLPWPRQFSKDNQFLAVFLPSAASSSLSIWNLNKQSEPLVIQGASLVSFSQDSRLVAVVEESRVTSGKSSFTLGIWDLQERKRVRSFPVGALTLTNNAVDWSPDGSRFVTTFYHEKKVRLWNAFTGLEEKCFTANDKEAKFWSCVFSSDGRTVTGWSDSGKIIAWDMETGVIVSEAFLDALIIDQQIYRCSPQHDYIVRRSCPDWIWPYDYKCTWIPQSLKRFAYGIFSRLEVFEYQARSGQVRKVIDLPEYLPRTILPQGQGLVTYCPCYNPEESQLAWWDLDAKSPWLTALYWAIGIATAYWLACFWTIKKWRSRSRASSRTGQVLLKVL